MKIFTGKKKRGNYSPIFIEISVANEIEFNSSNIKILEKGNLIKAYKATANIPKENITISGDNATYNKTKKILLLENNVKFFDNKKNIFLEANKIIYNQNKNLIYTI